MYFASLLTNCSFFTVFIATAKLVGEVGVLVKPKSILKMSDNLHEFEKEKLTDKIDILVTQNGQGNNCQCPSFKKGKDYLIFRTGNSQVFRVMPFELSNKNAKRKISQLAYYCKRRPR